MPAPLTATRQRPESQSGSQAQARPPAPRPRGCPPRASQPRSSRQAHTVLPAHPPHPVLCFNHRVYGLSARHRAQPHQAGGEAFLDESPRDDGRVLHAVGTQLTPTVSAEETRRPPSIWGHLGTGQKRGISGPEVETMPQQVTQGMLLSGPYSLWLQLSAMHEASGLTAPQGMSVPTLSYL